LPHHGASSSSSSSRQDETSEKERIISTELSSYLDLSLLHLMTQKSNPILNLKSHLNLLQ